MRPTHLLRRCAAAAAAAAPRRTAHTVSPAVAAWERPYSPGLLTPPELAQFFRDGFVLKHAVFEPWELAPSIAAVEDLVDTLANRLARGGKITDTGAGLPFETRLIRLEEQFPGAAVLLHKNGMLPPAIAHLWSHPRLLSVRLPSHAHTRVRACHHRRPRFTGVVVG